MNDALHELGRPNEAGRSRKSTRSLFQLRRSTATAISAYHGALQLWPFFYAADKQSSLAIFAAKRIPRSIRILSKDNVKQSYLVSADAILSAVYSNSRPPPDVTGIISARHRCFRLRP
jgi:hypothetical protein